jgi:hypothetical protein
MDTVKDFFYAARAGARRQEKPLFLIAGRLSIEADLTKSTFHTSPPPGDPSQHNASSLLLLNGKESSLSNR